MNTMFFVPHGTAAAIKYPTGVSTGRVCSAAVLQAAVSHVPALS